MDAVVILFFNCFTQKSFEEMSQLKLRVNKEITKLCSDYKHYVLFCQRKEANTVIMNNETKDPHLHSTLHNMELQEGCEEKKENVPNICFHKVLWVKGGTAGNYPIYEPNHIS